MRRLILFATAFVLGSASMYAGLTRDQSEDLAKVAAFTDSASSLPAEIRAACSDSSGKLADPGSAWEASDVITDPKLPQHRLIWAVSDSRYYVVHYEVGGRGHSYRVAVFYL